MRLLAASLIAVAAAMKPESRPSLVQINTRGAKVDWKGSHMRIAAPDMSEDDERSTKKIGEAIVSFAVTSKKQAPLMSQGDLNKDLEGLSPDCQRDFKNLIQSPEQPYSMSEDMKESMCAVNKGKQCDTMSVVTGDSIDEQTGHNVKVTYELEGKGCVPTTCYENANDLRLVARFMRKQAQRMRTSKQAPVKITLSIDCTHLGGAQVESFPGAAAGVSVMAALASMLVFL